MREPIEKLLISVAHDLLGAEGGHPEPRPQIPPSGAIVATIGFGGLDMNGALAVLALEPTVRTLVASVFDAEPNSDSLLCDMLGELSNLLLGRYRAALLRRGIDILPATPITLRAVDVDIRGEQGKSASWHAFTTPAGRFWLCLDVSFRAGFDISAPSHEPVETNELALVIF